MDKLILFLLIIVLILCFKNINVMVKKSDEGVMKVIIILIIVGLLFMCKGDLIEGVEQQMKDRDSMREFIFSLDKNGDNTFDEADFREIDSDGDGNITDTELDFKFLTQPITLESIRSSYDNYTSGITGLDPACGGIMCSKELNQPGECLDLNATPPVCSANSGDCPPGQINCSGNDSGADSGVDPATDQTLISNNEPFIKGICYTMPTMYVNETIAPDNIKTDVAANELWSIASSRGDLDILKKSGVTHLRVYDWDLNANHTKFLKDLEDSEIKLMLSISDYFTKNLDVLENSLDNLLKEITIDGKYRECIHSIIIGNEPDLHGGEGNYTNSMEAVKKLLNHENTNNITNKDDIKLSIPVSFGVFGNMGPGVKQIDDIIRIIKEKNINILNRFVPSIQTKNPASDIKNLFYNKLTPQAKRYIERMGFYITEWSLPPPGDDAPNSPGPKQANLDVVDTQKLMTMKHLKGIFGFQYLNPVDKTGVEKEFGFTRFNNCKEVNNCPSPSETICDYNGSMVALSEAYSGTNPKIPFC